MATLTASMVVDLKDRTGPGAKSAMRNLRNMKREGDMLARDMDRQMLDRVRRRDEMIRQASETGRLIGLGVVTAGVVAGKAFTDFAELERRVNRIAINAGQGADKVQPIIERLQKVAKDTSMGFDQTVEGLETLIASGRTLDEGLSFLPSVAITAQASGAAIKDVALSADALSGSLNIAAKDMQQAFDILVEGGKQGKFELKDMSQYLPSLLPLFSQIGYEGTKDLKKIVAMLQLVRNKAGTASEANTYLSNVVSKMFSNETNTKFKKFGVNLQKELRKAKDEGKDVMETFLDLTDKVLTKNKIEPAQLFSDMEFQRGVLALMSQRDKLKDLVALLDKAGGSTMKDFEQATNDAQGAIDRMSASWDKLWTKVGQKVAGGAVPLFDAINNYYDDNDAYGEGVRKTTKNDPALMREQEKEFAKQYSKRFPDKGPEGYKPELERMLQKVGRDQAKSVFEFFKGFDLADAYKAAGYQPGKGPPLPLLGDRRSSGLTPGSDIPEGKVPVPGSKPKPMTAAEVKAERDAERAARNADAYGFGDGRDTVSASLAAVAGKQREVDEILRQRAAMADRNYDWFRQYENGFSESEGRWHRAGNGPKPTTAAQAGAWRDASTIDPFDTDLGGVTSAAGYLADTLRQAADAIVRDAYGRQALDSATEAGARRQSFERETGPRWGVDPQPNALQSITGQVSLIGTPTVITQPSGVQQVTVTNPPQPNVYHISAPVTVTEAANGAEVARQFASTIKTAIAGTHADMNHQAHA